MIRAAQLSAMQAQVQRTMTDAVLIQRASPGRDTDGNLTATWATLQATVGKVGAPRVANEAVLAGQLTGVVTFTVALPAGTAARDTDRLVVGSRTYAIEGFEGPLTIELERRCICTLVEGL